MAEAQHSHEDSRLSFYLDQFFAIGVCGAIAGVTIMLWQSNLLGKMLHEKFHLWVALGAFSLLGIVLLRAIAVWQSVDEQTEAKHEHGPDCDHEHHHHDHDHGHSHGHEEAKPESTNLTLVDPPSKTVPQGHSHSHGQSHSHGHSHSHGGDGHDHGWAPWRYVVLLLPVVLYFIVLTNPAFDREPVELKSQWWTDTANYRQNLIGAIINFIVIFRSILWEALPFIILGAIIAGMLEELLPQRVITAVLPKNRFLAILMGGLLGIVFPMCECGIIPIMRRLLRKGLPLSCCIAYLLAGPVVNIVVLLSTFAAFSGMENVFEGGEPSYQMGGWWMLGFRGGMAYLTAIITALIVEAVHRKYGDVLLTPLARQAVEENVVQKRTFWQRLNNISETAMHDFIDITVFLILGTLLAATVRLFLMPDDIANIGQNHIVLAILAMMGLAIILCLCSEADAFVAASFVTLRPSAKLAFLVLGPMMDFKLYAMYTRIFRPRLILTIYLAVVTQVFVYSLGVHWFWETYKEYLITPQQTKLPTISAKEMEAWTTKAGQTVGLMADSPSIASAVSAGAMLMVSTTYEAPEVRFTQLETAAFSPEQRQYYEGKRVSIIGRFQGGSEQSFRLTRYKINCCAADARPLNVAFILAPGSKESLPLAQLEGNWVRVVGQVRFMEQVKGSGSYRSAILITPTEREPLSKLIEVIPPPANPYED